MAPLEAAPQESASKERFFRYFQLEVIALQEQMSRLPSTSLLERPDAIDHCFAGIARLSSEVKDASSYIPAYDQRTYGDAIKALHEKLQGVRNELAGGPRKFKFTTKKNPSAISIGDAVEMAQNKRLLGPGYGGYSSGYSSATGSAFAPTPLEKLSPGEEKKEQELMANHAALPSAEKASTESDSVVADAQGILLSNHHGSRVSLPPSAAHSGSSGTVSNVERSIVDLSAPTKDRNPFATLILKNIQDSLIICGRVTGPIHITGVENSVIITACRQFRMHGSKKVHVYLHCSSRPIIEDCDAIRFAPLPKQFTNDELSESDNQWDQIDDFKWLKAEPSPHFSILSESDRIADEIWRDNISISNHERVADILQSLGVSTSP